ncbi:protocadherin Fat 3-like [Gordionus sp. m RMFG-2023]|uniref:protocadherin Fat 3-like n=1 Tax=Gordionus sp. m RMFG-2023 TaxID=3053472 RepID=UPI0031FBA590
MKIYCNLVDKFLKSFFIIIILFDQHKTNQVVGNVTLTQHPASNNLTPDETVNQYRLNLLDGAMACHKYMNPFYDNFYLKIVKTDFLMVPSNSSSPIPKLKMVPSQVHQFDINDIIKIRDGFTFYIETGSETSFQIGLKKDPYHVDQNVLKVSFDLENIALLNITEMRIIVHGQGRIDGRKKSYRAEILFKFLFSLISADQGFSLYFPSPWTPQSPYIHLQIYEEMLIGSTLFLVNAFPSFKGFHPVLSYSLLENPFDFFTINQFTGQITIGRRIDLEKLYPRTNIMITVSVKVFETLAFSIDPQRLILNITILDVNDNPPLIREKEYHFSIPENVTSPLEITRFEITDMDVTKPSLHIFKIDSISDKKNNPATNSKKANKKDPIEHDIGEMFEFVSKKDSSLKQLKLEKSRGDGLRYDNYLNAELESEEMKDIYEYFDEDDINEDRLNKYGKEKEMPMMTNNILILKENARLDRETKSSYVFLVTISDMTDAGLTNKTTNIGRMKTYFYAKILIFIDIIDVNDNPPVCNMGNKVITVPDMIEIGSAIDIISATDFDDASSPNGQIHFYLNNDKNDEELIIVEELTGLIKVKSSFLGLPVNAFRKFSYRACNSGPEFENYCCHDTFAIKVQNEYGGSSAKTEGIGIDTDGPPNYIVIYQPADAYDVVDIHEDIALGSKVYEVKAKIEGGNRESWRSPLAVPHDGGDNFHSQNLFKTSRDRRFQIYYKIEEIPIYPEDHLSFFIHPKTGIIYTRTILDAESKRIYTIIVKASTGDLTKQESKMITIRIRDVNDNNPIFINKNGEDPLVLEAMKNANIGSKIGSVSAIDKDAEEINSKIYYHMIHDDGKVWLEKETGQLFVNGNLSESSQIAKSAMTNDYNVSFLQLNQLQHLDPIVKQDYARKIELIIQVTNSKIPPRITKLFYQSLLKGKIYDPSILRVTIKILEDLKSVQSNSIEFDKRSQKYLIEKEEEDTQIVGGQPMGLIKLNPILKDLKQLVGIEMVGQEFCKIVDLPSALRDDSKDFINYDLPKFKEIGMVRCHTSSMPSKFSLLAPVNGEESTTYYMMRNKERQTNTKTLFHLKDLMEDASQITMPDSLLNGYFDLKFSAIVQSPSKKSLRPERIFYQLKTQTIWDSYKSKFIIRGLPEESEIFLQNISSFFNRNFQDLGLSMTLDSLNYYMPNQGVLNYNFSEACFHVSKNGMVLEPSEIRKFMLNNRKVWNNLRQNGIVRIEKCYVESLYEPQVMEIVLIGIAILLILFINILSVILMFYKKEIIYYVKDDTKSQPDDAKINSQNKDQFIKSKEFYFGREREKEPNVISPDFYEWQEKSLDMIEVNSYKDKNDSKLYGTYYEISKHE